MALTIVACSRMHSAMMNADCEIYNLNIWTLTARSLIALGRWLLVALALRSPTCVPIDTAL